MRSYRRVVTVKNLICIICPNSCRITEENGIVTGYKCKRGQEFALKELSAPVRSVTGTVRTCFASVPVLPVRTDGEVPKESVFMVMKELRKVLVTHKVKCGEVIVKNVAGTGIDVIACYGTDEE